VNIWFLLRAVAPEATISINPVETFGSNREDIKNWEPIAKSYGGSYS
jgi:hypothetical protein